MSDEMDLPDTNAWQPRNSATETLQSAFLKRCLHSERLIQIALTHERQMAIDNFDSGIGFEEVIREEFRKTLPKRYTVTNGFLLDSNGLTAGHCDLLVTNEAWFPHLKTNLSPNTSKSFLPIESVYAIGEIKQTLSFKTLDMAMEKLVQAHRLYRPRTSAKRIVENRESGSCRHGLSNPLYSFVLAGSLAKGVSFDSISERFFWTSKNLKRLEVVRALCILDQGIILWSFNDPDSGDLRPALFMMEDLYLPIRPARQVGSDENPSLYGLFQNLLLHLYHSVLAPEDMAVYYGSRVGSIQSPKTGNIVLEPDSEWLESLKVNCSHDGDRSFNKL